MSRFDFPRDIASTGRRTRSHAFDLHHPLVPALLFSFVLVACVGFLHPVLCGISFAGAVAFSLQARGGRATGASIAFAVPLVVLVAVLNPFFSAQGETLMAQVLGRPLYVESLAYGVCMGAMLASALLWLCNAAAVLSFEDLLALFGRKLPTLAFVLSAMARLVPRYLRRGREVALVARAQTAFQGPATADGGQFLRLPDAARRSRARVQEAGRRFAVLAGASMEESLVTANSIVARGWSSQLPRTFYERVRFARRDAVACAVVVVLGVAALGAAWHTCAPFSFYPELSSMAWSPAYAVYALLCALPLLLEAKEALSWRR